MLPRTTYPWPFPQGWCVRAPRRRFPDRDDPVVGRRKDRSMRMRLVGLVALGAVGALGLAACGSSSTGGGSTGTSSGSSSAAGGGAQGGGIPPHTQSSAPREEFDKPYPQPAF